MKRNLIYHLTPIDNWKWHVEELKKRFSVFDGKRIVAVAKAWDLESLDVVKKAFSDDTIEYITVQNNPDIRESASLPSLLAKVESKSPREITFFGHSKGVTRGSDEAVHLWVTALYHQNLDRVGEIEALLEDAPCAGAFLRLGRFPNFPPGSKWHYSGTFFWFKNSALFSKNWNIIPKHRFGAEAYLSLLFDHKDAACIFGRNCQNLYKLHYIKKLLGETDQKKELSLEEKIRDIERRLKVLEDKRA